MEKEYKKRFEIKCIMELLKIILSFMSTYSWQWNFKLK